MLCWHQLQMLLSSASRFRPSADARRLADREGVEINTYSVIYDAIDDVKSTMVGMLDKVKKEIVTGQFEVKTGLQDFQGWNCWPVVWLLKVRFTARIRVA